MRDVKVEGAGKEHQQHRHEGVDDRRKFVDVGVVAVPSIERSRS